MVCDPVCVSESRIEGVVEFGVGMMGDSGGVEMGGSDVAVLPDFSFNSSSAFRAAICCKMLLDSFLASAPRTPNSSGSASVSHLASVFSSKDRAIVAGFVFNLLPGVAFSPSFSIELLLLSLRVFSLAVGVVLIRLFRRLFGWREIPGSG